MAKQDWRRQLKRHLNADSEKRFKQNNYAAIKGEIIDFVREITAERPAITWSGIAEALHACGLTDRVLSQTAVRVYFISALAGSPRVLRTKEIKEGEFFTRGKMPIPKEALEKYDADRSGAGAPVVDIAKARESWKANMSAGKAAPQSVSEASASDEEDEDDDEGEDLDAEDVLEHLTDAEQRSQQKDRATYSV